MLPYRSSLIIYKPLIRPYLDYGDAIDQPSNKSFPNKSETVKHNSAEALKVPLVTTCIENYCLSVSTKVDG